MLSSAKMSLIPLWERQRFVATEGMAGELCSRGRGHHSETMSCGQHCKVTWPMAKSMMPRRGKLGAPLGKAHETQTSTPGTSRTPAPRLTPHRSQRPEAPRGPSVSSLLYGQLCFRHHLEKKELGEGWKTEKSKIPHINRGDY